jgi:penicillin G amidase
MVVVPGLTAPVDILTDPWGVPHIYASTTYDVFLAQGFQSARDRLWQIDTWRRRGLGLLSEYGAGTSWSRTAPPGFPIPR